MMPNANIPLDVYELFDELAQKIIARGWTHYSADAILHRVRWHFHIERGDREFKCNNDWTALLARWWLKHHPEHPSFFTLRTSSFDNDQELA